MKRTSNPQSHRRLLAVVGAITPGLVAMLALTTSLVVVVVALGTVTMPLNPTLPNPPPLVTNLAPTASCNVSIPLTTPGDFTLVSGPNVEITGGSANVLWTGTVPNFSIVNTAPYVDWSKLEVSASWVPTNSAGGGGGGAGTIDRFATALANLDAELNIVWTFLQVGQPVDVPIDWTVAAFDSAGLPLNCSFTNIAGTGINPSQYADSWSVMLGTTAANAQSGTVCSPAPSTGTLKTDYSCALGAGTHTAGTTLMFAKVDLTPITGFNSPDFSPRLCKNAQSTYKSVAWQATVLPVGTTASIIVEENDLIITPSTVSNGDAVILELKPSSTTGDYALRITHGTVPGATATETSQVFKFAFAPPEYIECKPNGKTEAGNPQLTCEALKVSAGTEGGNLKEVGAHMYHTYKMKVTTVPAGAAAVAVKAAAKVSYTYKGYGKITKAQTEDGDTIGIGLGYGPISISYSPAGNNNIGAFATVAMVQFDSGPTTPMGQFSKSSADFTVPGVFPFGTQHWSEEQTFIISDNTRTYVVDTTQVPVRIGVAVSCRTTCDFGSVGLNPPSGVMVWQTTNADGESPPTIEEDDNVFEIVPAS